MAQAADDHPVRDLADGPADLVQHREGADAARLAPALGYEESIERTVPGSPTRRPAEVAGRAAVGGNRSRAEGPDQYTMVELEGSTRGKRRCRPGSDPEAEGETRWNPSRRPGPPAGKASTVEVLERAIAIYLEHAYRRGRAAAGRRADGSSGWTTPARSRWTARRSSPPSRPAPERSSIYSLRLGNARLSAHEAPGPALALAGRLPALGEHPRPGDAPRSRDSPRPRPSGALQAANQQFKQAIENAWDAAGLPTFLATSATTSRPASPATPSGADRRNRGLRA